MQVLPSAVLFCCTMNVVRSPMAEGILKRYHGRQIYVDSAGVTEGVGDHMMIEVMGEMGIDMTAHAPKLISGITDDSFDIVIALSEAARDHAARLMRYRHCDLRLWRVSDPSLIEGARNVRLAAYRQLRDELRERILELFPPSDL